MAATRMLMQRLASNTIGARLSLIDVLNDAIRIEEEYQERSAKKRHERAALGKDVRKVENHGKE